MQGKYYANADRTSQGTNYRSISAETFSLLFASICISGYTSRWNKYKYAAWIQRQFNYDVKKLNISKLDTRD